MTTNVILLVRLLEILLQAPTVVTIKGFWVDTYIHIHTRDETILQYIDILQYLLQQYNTIRLKGNNNILHIAIYCDILQYIAMFAVLML